MTATFPSNFDMPEPSYRYPPNLGSRDRVLKYATRNEVYSRREGVMNRFAEMEAFIAVVETGSFSAAARRLRVGQPAVSKTIAQLESRLCTKLLLRSTHGLTPTEAGQAYFDRARRAVQEADEAEAAARGANTRLSGRLRLCAAVTFARLHVIPRLPVFLAQHPELEIEVILDDRNVD